MPLNYAPGKGQAVPCPFCKSELYDGVIRMKGDKVSRCWNCLADVGYDERPWTLELRSWAKTRPKRAPKKIRRHRN